MIDKMKNQKRLNVLLSPGLAQLDLTQVTKFWGSELHAECGKNMSTLGMDRPAVP